MFQVVNEQNAREQLQLVAEQPQGERAGQKGCIHENALAERDVVRDLARLRENPICEPRPIIDRQPRVIGCRIAPRILYGQSSPGKTDLYMSDGQLGLIDEDGRRARGVVGEGDLPRSAPRAAMLDGPVGDRVTYRSEEHT